MSQATSYDRDVNRVGTIAVALVLGLLLGGGIALALQPDDGTAASASPAASTTVAVETVQVEAPWVEDGVRFRSTVLFPHAFVVGEGRAELEFELQPLHWRPSHDDELLDGELAVQPERWALTTTSGMTFEARSEMAATLVRFEIPETLEPDDVANVAVTGWRIAAPADGRIVVALEPGARGEFFDGTSVEVVTVLEQASSTIVQLDSRLVDDAWVHGGGGVPVAATDPGWRASFSFGQSSNLQLIWEGAEAPAEVELRQAYPIWIPVGEAIVVYEAETAAIESNRDE